MRRAVTFWVAFAVVHTWVAVSGYLFPNQPMGDVYLVYEPWSTMTLTGGSIPGIGDDWVYPHLALAPMLAAASLSWIAGYVVGWALLVIALNALGMAILWGDGRQKSRRCAGWFWLGFVVAIGPVGMYRLDAITVPMAVVGLLWLFRRPFIAAVVLSVAAWMKIWPGALIVAALVALRGRRRAVLTGAVLTTVLVVMLVTVTGGAAHLLGFVLTQDGRGLQVESPLALVALWQAAIGVPSAVVAYDPDILTFQVTAPGVSAVVELSTVILAAGVGAVVASGLVALARGVGMRQLLPPLALALVAVLIAFNKVGSPQFQVWLVAPVVLWIVAKIDRAVVVATLALVSAVLTQIIYPVIYFDLLRAETHAVAIITLRDAVMLALLVVSMWMILRRPRSGAVAPQKRGSAVGSRA